MIYVLAFPRFDAETTASLDRFRARHEPARAELVGPHVTLVFGLSGLDPVAFSRFCQRALADRPVVEIEFDGCHVDHDPHEQTYKMGLSCRRGHDAIMAMHGALYDGAHRTQFDPSRPYRPHMTVATHEDRAVLDAIEPSSIATFPIRGMIEAVTIVAHEGDRLRRLKTLPLKR